MDAHGEGVFGFCMRLVHERTLAQELTQQIFMEAYRDLPHFRGHASLRSWLYGIAYNRCMDAHRVAQRRKRLVEDNAQAMLHVADPGPGPIELVDRAQLMEALEECLQRLSPEVRATLLTRFKTNLTFEEMEKILNAKADALQVRVARALLALRKCLKKKGWSGE